MKKKGLTNVDLIIIFVTIIVLGIIVVPNFFRSCQPRWRLNLNGHRGCFIICRKDHGGSFTQCQSNCKNIGTALEMYSTDYEGHYPPSGRLDLLADHRYLKSIPTCADANADTYSTSYRSSQNPDDYSFCCVGENHKEVGVTGNYPYYNANNGLIPRP